jgi:predicted nucleotidyltransferase
VPTATQSEERLLSEIAAAARRERLDLVLIGNAAAALRGAPVTTRDVDFFVRDTAANLAKIERLAVRLGGLAITRPGAPLSNMVRLVGGSVEIDFVFALSSGARFESLRSRAEKVNIGDVPVRVASLADIIAAKRAAGRPKDLAALPLLEATARVVALIGESHTQRGRRKKNTVD